MNLIAYTDGACDQGHGGWSVVTKDIELSGYHYPASSNLMEIYAIYNTVEFADVNSIVHIYTDSKLCIGWLARGWKCKKDYIREVRDCIFATMEAKNIRLFLHKVEGHSLNELNNRADELAVLARSKK